MTILCLASYEKGHEFLREARRQGCVVILLTSESLQGKADWPSDSIDEIFYMPDRNHEWNRADTINAVSYLARTRAIDRIVALDDFDVELAASLREHLRVPGMGETTVRHFRDKLSMRMKAREAGIHVPDFVHVLNYDALRRFMENDSRALGAQAPLNGRRDRDQEDPSCRGILARHRIAGRYAVSLSAGAVCSGRHLPRGLHRRRKAGSVRDRLRLRAPADGSLP